jgi:hypothetical protein
MYVTLEEARAEVWRRWHDKALRRRVEEYLGELPHCFGAAPRAVLFRNIASPDIEFHHFVGRAKQIGLEPLCLEYTHDRFCTRNADKICLAKLAIFNGRNKHGEAMITYKKLIDLRAMDNKRFSEIDTLWGENLVAFHHGLMRRHLPGVEVFDVSHWHHFNGNNAAEYYRYFLALFVCHGLLIEDFVTNEEEERFTHDVVLPALEVVTRTLGVVPVIVPVIEQDNLSDMYWWCYPEDIAEEIEKHA